MCVADTICHSLSAKPSLKIRTANAIYWISPGIFRDYSLQNFFRNETFFVFQDRKLKLSASVRKEFPETSQSFNSFSSFRQLLISFFSICCLIELKFCEVSQNSFSNRRWKFQQSILKNKNKIFMRKIFFRLLSISKQKKSFVYWPNFQWRFWLSASHFVINPAHNNVSFNSET